MNNSIVVIHQPDFMPYLGFFHRLVRSDIFVVLDHVQFMNRGWQKRCEIKSSAKNKRYLSVHTKKTPTDTKIYDVALEDSKRWRLKHLNIIKQNYERTPYFDELFPYIKEIYNSKISLLADFNLKIIETLCDFFDIQIKTVLSSHLNIKGKKNDMVINIVKKTNSHKYLSGCGAKAYFDPAPYAAADIEVIFDEFQHPVYPQVFGSFIPYMSSIDLLFNCGIKESRKILRSF